MTSVISICNRALSRIAAQSISALTEASNEARQCALHYEPTRDTLLAEYPWRFSLARQALATVDEEGPSGWAFVYARPSDCLRALRLEPAAVVGVTEYWRDGALFYAMPGAVGHAQPWQEWGDRILAGTEGAVLSYVRRVEDPTLFPPLFADVLSWRLAAEVAMPVIGKVEYADQARNMAEGLLRRAREADGNAGSIRMADADFLRARA